jgi:3-hydroxyisobutyrate dehydrogenase and related beta-hydroxyacid dehydrogenases
MQYAYIGLGNLGGHLAASLAGAGFALRVHDRDPAHRARFDALGVNWADNAVEAARGADAVITCLPSPAVSEAVLAQILPAMKPGADWIEMSTLGRAEMLRLAGLAEAQGMGVLDARSPAACIWPRRARSPFWRAASPRGLPVTARHCRRWVDASFTWGRWARPR